MKEYYKNVVLKLTELYVFWILFFFFKQKTAYEMRISDWSSDVCSSDLPVDVETGLCGRGTILVNNLPQYVDDHPLTGTRMTGMALPDWDQVRDLVQAAARVFAVQKSLGWDVALTDSGPLLLEGNWHYDLTVNQLAPRRGILDTP